jgi:hypothetical protein
MLDEVILSKDTLKVAKMNAARVVSFRLLGMVGGVTLPDHVCSSVTSVIQPP